MHAVKENYSDEFFLAQWQRTNRGIIQTTTTTTIPINHQDHNRPSRPLTASRDKLLFPYFSLAVFPGSLLHSVRSTNSAVNTTAFKTPNCPSLEQKTPKVLTDTQNTPVSPIHRTRLSVAARAGLSAASDHYSLRRSRGQRLRARSERKLAPAARHAAQKPHKRRLSVPEAHLPPGTA